METLRDEQFSGSTRSHVARKCVFLLPSSIWNCLSHIKASRFPLNVVTLRALLQGISQNLQKQQNQSVHSEARFLWSWWNYGTYWYVPVLNFIFFVCFVDGRNVYGKWFPLHAQRGPSRSILTEICTESRSSYASTWFLGISHPARHISHRVCLTTCASVLCTRFFTKSQTGTSLSLDLCCRNSHTLADRGAVLGLPCSTVLYTETLLLYEPSASGTDNLEEHAKSAMSTSELQQVHLLASRFGTAFFLYCPPRSENM